MHSSFQQLSSPARNNSELIARLNLFDATMIIVGNIIGIGIFTTTGYVADALPNPRMIVFVWAFGGLITLCGALCYAELGAALPRAGGEYVFLREAYGPLCGFLDGWTYFLVTNPGSIAAMSVGAVSYLGHFWPPVSLERVLFSVSLASWSKDISTGQLAAVGIVVAFSAANYCGIRVGSALQNLLTVTKLGTVVVLAVLGLILGKGNWGHFSEMPAVSSISLLAPLSLAMIAVIFAYTGWFTSTYVASEIKEPQRNIPRSIVFGTLIVTVVYVLINLTYIYALPVERIRGVINVADTAALTLFGNYASNIVSLAIILSILGAINSVVMTAPRIYYAMARDELFFRAAGQVHRRFKSPSNSIAIQAIWSCVLVISGTFSQLLTYTVVAMLTFSIMTGGALFVLRARKPELPRPFRTPGFPWTAALFVLSYVLILSNVLWSRPRESLLGLGIVAAGAPVYLYWKRTANRLANPH